MSITPQQLHDQLKTYQLVKTEIARIASIRKDTQRVYLARRTREKVSKLIQQYQQQVYINAKDKGLSQKDTAGVVEFSVRTAQRMEAGSWQPKRGLLRGQPRPAPLEEVWDK